MNLAKIQQSILILEISKLKMKVDIKRKESERRGEKLDLLLLQAIDLLNTKLMKSCNRLESCLHNDQDLKAHKDKTGFFHLHFILPTKRKQDKSEFKIPLQKIKFLTPQPNLIKSKTKLLRFKKLFRQKKQDELI